MADAKAISSGFRCAELLFNEKKTTLILQESPWTPLMAAVKNNQIEVVEYLLDKKVSTAPVPFSTTALHLAAERNHFECIRLLLRHNALVDPLKGNRDRETPLHLATHQGFVESASLLLEHGADPNAKNGRGEMPLHLACQVKSPPLISLLLDKKTLVSQM